MKQDDMIAYLTRQATDAGCDQNGLKDHVTLSLSLALGEFWNAHPWSFRRFTIDLPVNETKPRWELDEKADSFTSITDMEGNGRPMRYKIEEAFYNDRPGQESYTPGEPQEVTVEYDSVTLKWYLRFWPRPTARTIRIRGLRAIPDSVDIVPTKFVVGVELAALKRILPAASSKRVFQNGETVNLQASRQSVAKEYFETVQYLKTIDSPYRGVTFQMRDDGDDVQMPRRIGPW